MLDRLKENIGFYKLSREVKSSKKKRSPKVSNFQSATKVGIIYRGVDEKHHDVVKRFVNHLKQEEGIRHIMALAYYEEKQTPFYLQSKLNFDYISRKDVNWYGKPSGTTVRNFEEEQYDILIDLTLKPCLPLMFVLLNSNARFKVGKYSLKYQEAYDMMINIEKDSLKELIEQVNYYLTIINRKEEVKTA